MDQVRRILLLGGMAAAVLSGCGAPPALQVNAQGTELMNPGPDGSGRPLTLSVVQMRGTAAFDAADFFALQDPQAALAADLVKTEQIALAPGGTASRLIAIEEGVTTVGFVAGFRDPAGKVFRVKIPAPTGPETVRVEVSERGISITPE